MRPIGRIVFLAMVIALAAAGVRAQDPDATVQASKPVPAVTPAPETLPETAELTPNEDAAPEDGAPEAAAAGSLGGDAATASSEGDPGPVTPKVDVEPLAPVASPAVETAATSSPLADENPARGERASDWIFLGVLALSAAVILARLTRRQEESLSIYGNRAGAVPPPTPSGPPIVLRS